MVRSSGTTRIGGSFDEKTIDAVWKKGAYVSGSGAEETRKDICGKQMRRGDHGTTTTYGWEIDHIKPVALGGDDDLSNLQPLHWENNRQKGDKYPWKCGE